MDVPQMMLFCLLLPTNLVFAMSVGGRPDAHLEDSPEPTCSYTFHVPRSNGQCQPWRQPEARDPFCLHYMEAMLTHQHALLEQQLNLISEQLKACNANADASGVNEDDGGQSGGENYGSNFGTVFTRWGSTSCPETAEFVYEGFAAKSHFTEGGGVNYQCLPEEPEFPRGVTTGFQSKSYIYGVEYEDDDGSPVLDPGYDNQDVPCVVCEVHGRSRMLVISARLRCPQGWTQEYRGLFMAQLHTQQGSDFICVDEEMEILYGGANNDNGGSLYVVEAKCGSLKCPPYVDGYELGCVVCTK